MSDLGWLTTEQVKSQLPEFESFYQNYEIEPRLLSQLQRLDLKIEITVILGLWCPDCFREVSRFIRLVEQLNLSHFQVSYLSVDREKQDPQNFAKQYEFNRIPTFIVQFQQQELGRIIEQPEKSLAEDLLAIIERAEA